MVMAIAASIMFLLSFIVRKNDPKAGGGVAVGKLSKLSGEAVQ